MVLTVIVIIFYFSDDVCWSNHIRCVDKCLHCIDLFHGSEVNNFMALYDYWMWTDIGGAFDFLLQDPGYFIELKRDYNVLVL